MNPAQLCFPDLKVAYGKLGQYRRFQQPRKKNGTFERKGMERWHRAVSTNLVEQNVLIPKEESSSGSDPGSHGSDPGSRGSDPGSRGSDPGSRGSDPGSRESLQNQKPKWMKKMKTAFGRMLSHKGRSKPASMSREGSSVHGEALGADTPGLLPRLVKVLSSPKLFTKPRVREHPQNATIQLDVVEAETEEITQGDQLLQARRTTKRLSVISLPSGMQKVSYSPKKRLHCPTLKKKKKHGILQKSDLTVGKLQMQVDDLIETMNDKSMKLLAQRLAELQQCEFLGDKILQSSKQFQKISKRTVRKYKLKKMCFPCPCCCF